MKTTLPDWLNPEPWLGYTADADAHAIRRAIYAENPSERELATLLSPQAGEYLEEMAQRAQQLTQRHFGRTISLYAPLYLSNFCNAGCAYCGFASDRDAQRWKLNEPDLRQELEAMRHMGLQEIVLLTGERLKIADVPYIADCIRTAGEYMHSVNVEVFAMEEREYRTLAEAGCSGVTLYQETYDPAVYAEMHRWGEKSNFEYRIDAPDRALRGGIRNVGIGILLGLSNPYADLLTLYRHARHLLKTYWQAGVSISFPRIRPELGGFQADFPVYERMLAQFIFAFRICLPEVPLVLSTREPERIRDGLAGVGISKMSVASKTTVGGYSKPEEPKSTRQFDISDERTVDQFTAALQSRGLDPVFKNWDATYREPAQYR